MAYYSAMSPYLLPSKVALFPDHCLLVHIKVVFIRSFSSLYYYFSFALIGNSTNLVSNCTTGDVIEYCAVCIFVYCIDLFPMGICLEQWRVAVGLFHRCKIGGHHTFLLNINPIWFVRELLKSVFLFFNMFCGKFHRLLDASILNYQFSIIMILLLLEAGDVERNPGPNPDHTLSFLHLNIRSIRNKIDFLKDNFKSCVSQKRT